MEGLYRGVHRCFGRGRSANTTITSKGCHSPNISRCVHILTFPLAVNYIESAYRLDSVMIRPHTKEISLQVSREVGGRAFSPDVRPILILLNDTLMISSDHL